MNILLTMMIIISISLLTLNHPLSMGLILILQTIIISIIMGYMLKSFLFSYIIIIIMLSGALVLFIYMASVASNEKFNWSNKMIVMLLITSMCMIIIMYKYNNNWLINNSKVSDSINLIKLFNLMSAKVTLLMIIYLLLTMIVVSNIAKTNKGPLRMNSK
uniref:NADH-ubiquinone oxidoreductase chain 6 n=1 Tax=Caystrus obscurus TaxID=2575667 RepID=A0A4D6X470_9HEMI|nr:NADH dehydrogenase subunit 6 [Caystrus obscurus]QCI09310.1 NADH dehydrogenase subunit 6 [Caystrus obscurus]